MIGNLLGHLSWNTVSGTQHCPHKCLRRAAPLVSNETNGIEPPRDYLSIKKSKKANLHSIVDISNNAKNLSKKYKIPSYSNVSELLNSKKLDAVIVATPNQLHEKHTVSFLKNKIPVLLEKPISDNINSAKKIISSSNKNKNSIADWISS